jgi:hydrogenase 3 maturation protease
MRGDDSVGPMVIDELKKTNAADSRDVLLLDCQHFPESFLKQITEFKPDKLIMVDTSDFKGKPGEFREIDPDSVKKQSLSTHRMPLTMMIDYLRSRIDFELVFIGVQPKQTGFDIPVSDECRRAVKEVNRFIISSLHP